MTVGIGFTVITKVIGVPEHVSPAFVALGVTVMLPEIGAALLLVARNDGRFPVAPIPKPMAELELAHV